MTSSFHFVERELSDTRSRVERDRENAGRPAVVEIQQKSSGVGQFRILKAVMFPVVFRTEPHLVTGSAVLTGPDPKLYNDPRGTAGVWGWQRSGRYYTGAFIWLRADCDMLDATATPSGAELAKTSVQHYLTFSAIAVKNLPTKRLNAASTRKPGLR